MQEEFAGNSYATSDGKIGIGNLQWVVSEAAVLFLRNNAKSISLTGK